MFGARMIGDLLEVRRLSGELKTRGYDVEPDEREYCRYCNDNKNNSGTKPVFKIRFNNNDAMYADTIWKSAHSIDDEDDDDDDDNDE